MPRFVAEAELRFECESQEAVGRELRRLQEVVAGAGFELRRARVDPAPPDGDDDSGWTNYVPLLDPDN